MKNYIPVNPDIWIGRTSNKEHYLHEKVRHINLNETNLSTSADRTFAILGYACDEGVKRNQGRTGTVDGPDAIRQQLAKMPNHLSGNTSFMDIGNIQCLNANMESSQTSVAETVSQLLELNIFPLLLGGGHDMAYGHYNGIKKHLIAQGQNKTIGIINFDAHFDLRQNQSDANSGTPFYQIAQECKLDKSHFKYLCLGIRKDANNKALYETAKDLGVSYIEKKNFDLLHFNTIKEQIDQFIKESDYIYTTIDLDGFSSAYAAGVSAASPMGFSPEIVLECLEIIMDSKKMVSLDIAEMNPHYDIDHQTAKLAASLIHFVLHHNT